MTRQRMRAETKAAGGVRRGFAGALLAGMVILLVAGGCGRKDPRIQEGYDLVVAGKVDEAVALANAMLTEDPENAAARNVLGLALYKSGDAEGAVEQYQRALELDPKFPEAHFNLGNAYERLERMQEAETEYATAVRHQPKFVLARYNLASIYAHTNRNERAITELRRTVELDPQFYFGYLLLGQLAYHAKDFDTAVQNLTRALELDPSVKEVHVLLGNAHLQSGREDAAQAAEKSFRAAVEIDSTYVDALYSLGMALATQDRNEEAAEWLRKARPLAEGRPEQAIMVRQLDDFTARTGISTTPPETAPAAAPDQQG